MHKDAFKVYLRNLYALSFSVRKDVLYKSVKRFVKMRKEDLNAFFTASLRNRKFKISCCEEEAGNLHISLIPGSTYKLSLLICLNLSEPVGRIC